MKKFISFCIFFYFIFMKSLYSQNNKTNNCTKDCTQTIYHSFEWLPYHAKFKGENGDIYKFFSKNMKYPNKAKEKGIEGKVLVSFVVEEDGFLSEVKIEKGPNDLHEEALRLVNLTNGLWIPAKDGGDKPARSLRVININFSLK